MHLISKKGKFLYSSLKTQMIMVLIILSVVPVVFIGVFTYMNTMKQINSERTNTLEAYSQMVLNNVQIRIGNAENLLNGLSNNSDLIATLKDFDIYSKTSNSTRYYAIQMQLQTMVRDSKKVYETVNIADICGNTVMDGSKNSNFYLDKPFYEMDFFDHIKLSGEMFIGNPIKSIATGKLLLPISKSIKSTEGFLGIATIMVDISEFSNDYNRIYFGKTNKVILLSERNIILYDTDKSLIDKENKIDVLNKILKDKSNNKGSITYNIDGEKRVMVYLKFTKTGWLICTQINESEFAGPANKLRNIIIITLVILIGLSVCISLVFSGYISRPLAFLIKSMKKIEKGDLDIQSFSSTSVRELQEMGESFTSMVNSLKALINNIIEASNHINDSTLSMTSASQNSLSYAENTIQDVLDITRNVKEQAKGTSIISNSIEGLALKINTAKTLSDEISIFSNVVNESAEKGLKSVGILKEKSIENTKNTKSVDDVIKALNEEIREINKMAQTIENIAKQTNLLSFNAAIEAARSGEAGRGFAVVADEIKNLSEQTRTETGEINRLIQNIRKSTTELVDNMESTSHAVDEQNIAVMHAQKAFNEIYNSIKDVNSKISNITVYLEQMKEDKDGIIVMVQEISNVSGEVAVNSERVKDFATNQVNMIKTIHESAASLNTLADNLDKSIVTFKL